MTVTYAAEENKITLSDYAKVLPEVRAERGSVRPVRYDEATQLFQVAVHPVKGGHDAERVIEE